MVLDRCLKMKQEDNLPGSEGGILVFLIQPPPMGKKEKKIQIRIKTEEKDENIEIAYMCIDRSHYMDLH